MKRSYVGAGKRGMRQDRARLLQPLLLGVVSTLLAFLVVERVASAATTEGSITVQVGAVEVGMCADLESYEDADYLIDEGTHGWTTAEGALNEFILDRTAFTTSRSLKLAKPTLTTDALSELHEITIPSRELKFVKMNEHLGSDTGESYEAWDRSGKTRVGLVVIDEREGRYNVDRSVICNSALYTDADRFMELLHNG